MRAIIEYNREKIVYDVYNSVNLLEGIVPIIEDDSGNKNLLLQTLCQDAPTCYTMLTDDQHIDKHIDIFSENARLTYDLGKKIPIDRIGILGFYGGNDYGLDKFEIYLSDSLDSLYNSENRVLYHDNSKFSGKNPQEGIGADFLITLECFEARFFGLRIIKSNPTDDIIRLSCISLYNDDYTKQKTYLKRTVDDQVCKGIKPLLTQSVSSQGNVDTLCNGEVFTGEQVKLFSYDNVIDCIFPISDRKSINAVSVFFKNGSNCEIGIFACDAQQTLFDEKNSLVFEREDITEQLAVLRMNEISKTAFLGLRFYTKETEVENIGFHNFNRKITVDQSRVINDNFFSTGVNCLPMALMDESLQKGYNSAFWQLERKRIIDAKPNLVRLWFQIDWFVTEESDYINGTYHFDSRKMQAVYPYLDAFLEAGSEIEIAFGIKAGKKIQDWYSFQEYKPEGSAPKDLAAFAKAYCATVRELVINRGYSNIKYLSFSNEPSVFGDDFNGPFKNDLELAEYWRKMADEVERQLCEEGLRELVQVWGTEQVGGVDAVYQFLRTVEGDNESPLDMFTTHWYDASYEQYKQVSEKMLTVGKTKKPHLVSEHGIVSEHICWDTNHTASLIAMSNYGCSGALLWCMCGVDLTDPLFFRIGWDNDLWGIVNSDTSCLIFDTYYPWTLFARYVPCHSKVLYSHSDNDDVRTAAYITKDNDLTVVAEARDGCKDRKISVDFGKSVNKVFYKHTYSCRNHYSVNAPDMSGNAILPPCEKEIFVGDSLEDELNENYQVIFYTTIKPYVQVEMSKVYSKAKPGETIKLSARDIDNSEDDCFDWSIVYATGDSGDIDTDGNYTVSKLANAGDCIAVKASLRKNEKIYGISVIEVN